MFREKLLKMKMMETDITHKELAKYIGIAPTTLYRKIYRNGDFSRSEIIIIAHVLKLNNQDLHDIFFEECLA